MSKEISVPSQRPRRTREELKQLNIKWIESDQVTPPAGIPTGWNKLDHHLLWNGFPKKSLSLLLSDAGGATTLWTQAAAQVTSQGQWAAWINDDQSYLHPWNLRHKGVDLSRLLCVSTPSSEKQLVWALQELMSLSLFELVGCNLGNLCLRESQVMQLKKLAIRYQTAVVFLSRNSSLQRSSFYSLILHFQRDHVQIDRALHRPTPHILERRDLYADTLPQLSAGRQALCG